MSPDRGHSPLSSLRNPQACQPRNTSLLILRAREGRLWPGGPHATATILAWGVYAVLVVLRFGAGQGGPRSAWSAMAGFALLLVAVLGVGLLP